MLLIDTITEKIQLGLVQKKNFMLKLYHCLEAFLEVSKNPDSDARNENGL